MNRGKTLYLPANLRKLEEQFCAQRADLKIWAWSRGGKENWRNTESAPHAKTSAFKLKFPFKRGKLKTLCSDKEAKDNSSTCGRTIGACLLVTICLESLSVNSTGS